MDPLAEKYLSLSPYAYCANNPILFIDPDGMKFTGDTNTVNQLEAQAEKNITYEQRFQGRIQTRIDRRSTKGKSTSFQEKMMARSEFREANYQATYNEIGEMRASENTYEINTNYSSTKNDGQVVYLGTDANGNYMLRVDVSQAYLPQGGLAHELVHGYQFESGQMDFSPSGTPGYLMDITDEITAFQRQFAFMKSSLMYSVNEPYVRSLTNSLGDKIYRKGLVPSGPININTSHAMISYYHTGRLSHINTPYKNLNWPYIHK